MIAKLQNALDNQIKITVKSKSESHYLEKYRKIVHEHCKRLLNQTDKVPSIKL